MTTNGDSLYQIAQKLLRFANDCLDDVLATGLEQIARELLEIAYEEDKVIEIEVERKAVNRA